MTHAAIARRAGVSPSTISRIASPGTRRVSRITADAIQAVMPV